LLLMSLNKREILPRAGSTTCGSCDAYRLEQAIRRFGKTRQGVRIQHQAALGDSA